MCKSERKIHDSNYKLKMENSMRIEARSESKRSLLQFASLSSHEVPNERRDDEILTIIDLTGGYEKLTLNTFYNNNFKNIMLAEGLKVKNFKKSLKNNSAKTDKLNCLTLIDYGKHFHDNISLYTPQSNDRELITQLYNRVEDIKEAIQREKNRIKQPNLLPVMEISIQRQLKFLKDVVDILKNEMQS